MKSPDEPYATLVAMAGLPGTGKSTLARALARRTGGVVIEKDAVRAALFGPDDVTHERAQDDLCFRAVLEAAAYVARGGRRRAVFVDGRTFSKRGQVDELTAFARANELDLRVIECTAGEDTVRARLETDAAEGLHPARNRDFRLYQRLALDADEIALENERARLVVHTDRGTLEELVAKCAAWITPPA